ncbi:MAG: 30S ribosomal protein S6 [Candidatus Amesbacteria bacterium GW2011_GWA2_47_11b]|uniref:Small ribosomal subunit protein bS6 n=3 Tax=Candidatus Amesiibacteriota TaxID=1752730 RepID=A0A0G1SLD2_9BACT|nr:MAG: 30S ribosomal protein S6 [Microgenomates group bacterium GW2011_GWC1_46_20]KKU58402.1 MAG: 30S ribosomal protein S6 [Candidatus Amesbacteria bacterium GW2011_GWA2_47_11b]KKU70221.1 MAG: 30S ribosomal protein S6 [Candidatus Amesbacteria bacterium GW2011_GWA1_47_20]KKU83246.1 MAG: 30S ribosomal protein S6 [Candidatus Amesbacteria bacterium GW2011_GWC2_47_8]
MNKYDLTVLVKKAEGVEAKIEKLVKALEGKLGKFTEMGKKQLAYPIAKTREAIFLNWVVEIPEAGVVQLTKKLTIDKEILRHLCLRVR